MSKVMESFNLCGVVPVVVLEDANDAVATAEAMLEGGISCMEIVLRTDAALDSIAKVAAECPDMIVGAGTVINLEQCKQSIDKGAQFIVSPGYDSEVVDYCLEYHFPNSSLQLQIGRAHV